MTREVRNLTFNQIKQGVVYTNGTNSPFTVIKIKHNNNKMSLCWKFTDRDLVLETQYEDPNAVVIEYGTMEVKEPVSITIGDLV